MIERAFMNPAELSAGLSDLLKTTVEAPGAERRAVMLAGGRTPLDAYRTFTESSVIRKNAPVFFMSDERHVPSEDRENNAGVIAPLFIRAGLPESRFLRVDTLRGLDEAARRYHADIEALLASGVRIPLGLLGVGADGHTASLFTPDDVAAATASGALALAVRRPSPPDRISVTPRLLARVERLLLVVTGLEKAAIVERFRSAPETTAAGLAVKGHPAVELWTAI